MLARRFRSARMPKAQRLAQTLERALAPELPLLARDGGFIAAGYDARSMKRARCVTTAARSSRRCRRATPKRPALRA
jgi:hypothetical protein